MIPDAGVLISIDRGDLSAQRFLRTDARAGIPIHTTQPVVAQVWRDGARQARLASFLKTVALHSLDDGPAVGRLLAVSGGSDVVDAHLVLVAFRLGADVLTGDPDDIAALCDLLGRSAPKIHRWP